MKTLPEEFIERLHALGHDAFRRLPEVIGQGQSPVAVRINRARRSDGLLSDLSPDGIVPWNPDGIYLASRPAFTSDPRLHQGVYYVQDASSMAVRAAVVEAVGSLGVAGRPLRYLDACAAPGGKTTAAVDALPPSAFVVANEADPRRAQILIENIAKWGATACVTAADASRVALPDAFFDIIAADVPCSGEGMMRKDEFAVAQWSPALVRECAALQRRIVANLWGALRPGGFLIYSTCTFNVDENEAVVSYMINDLGGEPVRLPLDYDGVLGAVGGYDLPVYRFVPGQIRGEGLFVAMVRKPDDTSAQPRVPQKVRLKVKTPKGLPALAGMLRGDYVPVADAPLRVVPAAHLALYDYLGRFVKPVYAGIEPGTVKGKDFIPSQHLALSRDFRRNFPEHEVDLAAAQAYLRRESVVLPADTPRGTLLLTHRGNPLGWVKNLGNRANNQYPDNWRVRH